MIPRRHAAEGGAAEVRSGAVVPQGGGAAAVPRRFRGPAAAAASYHRLLLRPHRDHLPAREAPPRADEAAHAVFAARVAAIRDGLARHRGAAAGRDGAAMLLRNLDRDASAAATAVAEQRRWIRLAEAAIGLRLLEQGAAIETEVPGPHGRTCDFLVDRDGTRLALHIKLLGFGGVPPRGEAGLAGRERALERIARPFLVEVRARPGLAEEAKAELSLRLRGFILQGRVGEEQAWRDGEGRPLGEARILGVHEGDRVRLVKDAEGGFDRRVERVRRLMRKACGQFLPGVPNIVLFAAGGRRLDLEVERALLGSSVERWDLHPAIGERVAHGRADDGFWQGGRAAESSLAGWFDFLEPRVVGRWWSRPGRPIEAPVAQFLDELVGLRREG